MKSSSLRRGSVVIVDFGGPAKIRPALVVQNDRDNARLTNTIVVQITSNITRSHESTQYAIDPSHPDWSASALRRPSAINCANIACVEQRSIVRVIGTLSSQAMTEIDECLKSALGLS